MRLPYNEEGENAERPTPNAECRERNCRATAPVACRRWQAMRRPTNGGTRRQSARGYRVAIAPAKGLVVELRHASIHCD